MNGHFMDFCQLVQKLERITPIISTLQDNQNEWSFYGFLSTVSKVRTNNTNHLCSSRHNIEFHFSFFLGGGGVQLFLKDDQNGCSSII